MRLMEPHTFSLANGLDVLLIDTETFPTVTMLLLVGAGSRYETEDNNGVAHFFEHMVFKGSQKYPNSHTIASLIEGLGGVFNAFTSKDHTGYWIKAPTKHFDTCMDLLSDIILHPMLEEHEIEREKGVITEEIHMYEDMPQHIVEEELEHLLYPNDALGYDIIGSKTTVQNMTRKKLLNYINTYYSPNNSVLVIAGGLKNNKNYKKIIEQKLQSWEKRKIPLTQKIQEHQTQPMMRIRHKKTEQAHFCLAHRAYSYLDDRKYALNVLGAILGGGMSSRLFIEVRERRGLCYYVSTSRESYVDCGSLITQAGVVNDREKIREAVKVILHEQQDIVNGHISDKELIRAKEMLKGRILLSLENSHSLASYYGTKKILEDKIIPPQEITARLDKVTKDDCIAVAQDIFQLAGLNFALIGPYSEEDFSSLLT